MSVGGGGKVALNSRLGSRLERSSTCTSQLHYVQDKIVGLGHHSYHKI